MWVKRKLRAFGSCRAITPAPLCPPPRRRHRPILGLCWEKSRAHSNLKFNMTPQADTCNREWKPTCSTCHIRRLLLSTLQSREMLDPGKKFPLCWLRISMNRYLKGGTVSEMAQAQSCLKAGEWAFRVFSSPGILCLYIYICVYVLVCIGMCICTYLCIYIGQMKAMISGSDDRCKTRNGRECCEKLAVLDEMVR